MSQLPDFDEINERIAPLDQQVMDASIDHWNATYKPIGSLGLLEDIITQIAGLTGDMQVSLDRRVVVPMCADNGVWVEGISQSPQDMTAFITQNMALGTSSVCVMGAVANAEVAAVNVGVNTTDELEGVDNQCVMLGTNNMAQGPAMTREQAVQAVMVGIEKACQLAEEGADILISGEMGIGNTTSSAAVASVLLGVDVEEVTGKGSGLSNDKYQHKIDIVKRAVEVNQPDPNDVLDVVSKVGGLDIAAMAGLYIGGALYRVPVLIDGMISMLSALVATRLCPNCRCAMIPTHLSAEPAAQAIARELDLHPVIYGGLRLGEGTGAVCLLPMLDMALVMYNGATFESHGQDAYEVYEGLK